MIDLHCHILTGIDDGAHNVKRRPPNLLAGRNSADENIGGKRADSLVYDTPKLISESKFIN